MLSFVNDYSEGAHEQVLRRLAETNREQQPGYGTDPYCARAKEKIRRACGCPEGDVFFLVGGTQTNQAELSKGNSNLITYLLYEICPCKSRANSSKRSSHKAAS